MGGKESFFVIKYEPLARVLDESFRSVRLLPCYQNRICVSHAIINQRCYQKIGNFFLRSSKESNVVPF